MQRKKTGINTSTIIYTKGRMCNCKMCYYFVNEKCFHDLKPKKINGVNTCYMYAKASDNNGIRVKERKTPRKRCKTCEHFLYSYNEKTRKYGYCCEISGEFAKSYNQLKDCKSPNYKKKS